MLRLSLLAAVLLTLAAPVRSLAAVTGVPDTILRDVAKPAALPSGAYEPVSAWPAVDSPLSHKTGQAVADTDARGGRAWEAKTFRDTAHDAMSYGPYASVPAGDYVAFYRLKLLEDAGAEEVAILDAAVGKGATVAGFRRVLGSDLRVGRYVEVPLAFHCSGEDLECRVMWSGYAGLRLDGIDLFRLTGATLEVGAGMVEQPQASGKPSGLRPVTERRPYADLLPRSNPPADTLVAYDPRRYPSDYQLMLATLQGLVNRTQPRIYSLATDVDKFWLDRMVQKGWIKRFEAVDDARELVRRFASAYKGAIVTDPAVPATKNVATMLAGLDGALVVSPRLSKELGLPVVQDLRGRWKTNGEAYQWAFDNLWPRLNHHVAACLYPDSMELRDYLVANRILVFWLPGRIDGASYAGDPNADVASVERMLAKMPVNTPFLGYPWAGVNVGMGEGPGVTLFAEFGHYLVGSSGLSNATVHSGIRLPKPVQKPAPPAPSLDRSKVYVSFLMSDGDNLPVLSSGNFPQLWLQPQRGSYPMTWTMSPAAPLLLPDIVDYFYSTSTPDDYWVAAVSGIGYTYPDSYGKRYRDPQAMFDQFLDLTRTHMADMDLRASWIMNATRPEIISRYAERMPKLEAIWPDYGRTVADYGSATYPTVNNIPVFRALTNWRENDTHEQKVQFLVDQVKALTPTARPAFMHLFIWNWGAELSVFQEALQRLGAEYVPVRGDHLASLYREELSRDKLFARGPSAVTTVAGAPVRLDLQAQNVTQTPMAVAVSVEAGLTDAKVKPSSLRMQPGMPAAVVVTGRSNADRVTVKLQGGGAERTVQVGVRQVKPAEVLGGLPDASKLRFVEHTDAVAMGHNTGDVYFDPTSASSRVWAAKIGPGRPTHMVFGPYHPLKAGRYIVLFRLKRMGEGTGVVARLDTAVAGGTPQTGQREVTAEELPVDQWRWAPIEFTHPGGAYEARVFWTGAASLAVEGVDVWEVTAR